MASICTCKSYLEGAGGAMMLALGLGGGAAAAARAFLPPLAFCSHGTDMSYRLAVPQKLKTRPLVGNISLGVHCHMLPPEFSTELWVAELTIGNTALHACRDWLKSCMS